MKVGIISHFLNPPRTGVGNVIYNMLNNIPEEHKKNIYLINY